MYRRNCFNTINVVIKKSQRSDMNGMPVAGNHV